MDLVDIKTTIPHREPFLFLEQIKEIVPGCSVTAIMRNGEDEPHYRGHFPQNPIMPGVLIVEALAQAACYLFVKSVCPAPESTFYMGTIKMRFANPSTPKDEIELDVRSDKMLSVGALFSVTARSGQNVLVSGELGIVCKARK